MCLTPNSLKASTSALTTAGSAPTEPASPAPLTPSGLVLVGPDCLEIGAEIVRVRHGVIHERAGDELAGFVVDDMLHQRLAGALRDAAVDLAVQQQRVELDAEVVDHGIAHDLDLAGVGSISTSRYGSRSDNC